MSVYICSILLLIILEIILNPQKNNLRKGIFIGIEFGYIIIISSLRSYEIGLDLKGHYYLAFIKYLNYSFNYLLRTSSYEPGYILFYKIIGIFTHNPQWMIAVHAIIVYSIIARFIYKYSDNPFCSILLFIACNTWFTYLSMLRQSMAIVFILLGIENIEKEKIKTIDYFKFFIWVIIASQFHVTALFMLLYPIIKKLKFDKKTIIISLIFAVTVCLLSNKIFVIASKIISTSKDYYSRYANDKGTINLLSVYQLIIAGGCFVIGYITLILRKKNTEKEAFPTSELMYLTLFLTATRIIRMQIPTIARVSEYLIPFTWILYPRAIENVKNKKERELIKFIFYTVLIVCYIYIGYTSAKMNYGTVPYKFFWK